MHLYIVVPCKTPKCGVGHILLYIGEKGKCLEGFEYLTPHPLMIECPTCHHTYDYARSKEEYFLQELPYPPPKGYSNKLSLSEILPELPLNRN